MQFYPPSYYDDKANGYTDLTTIPLASAMGAEIQCIDLANLNDQQFEQIKSALFRYKMVYFRNQNIQIEDQEALTERFGEFGTDAYTSGMEGHPNVQCLVKEADTVVDFVFGSGWHTDSPFMAQPPSVSMLFGKEIPPYGGDTMWCNTELAYNFLSTTMKELLAPLKVHMSAADVLKNVVKEVEPGVYNVGEMDLNIDPIQMVKGALHPLVRTHPSTGKKSLYLDGSYSLGIEGMTEREGSALLGFLVEHITQEAFSCRLRWEPNMLVIWDNRASIHNASNDYDGYRREMYRTIVNGEVPV